MSRLTQAWREFHVRHERLKHFVHNSMRYPLPPAGRRFMGFVYFLIPVVGGYQVMQWAIGKAHASIGEHGENLPVKTIEGWGDKRVVDGEQARVGAGGWGGGVHLAVSDPETQEKNRQKLNQFLRSQKKKQQKKEEVIRGEEET